MTLLARVGRTRPVFFSTEDLEGLQTEVDLLTARLKELAVKTGFDSDYIGVRLGNLGFAIGCAQQLPGGGVVIG